MIQHWARATGLAVSLASTLAATPALAGTTGHVGVFSDYVFRGIVAEGGAAVQGGIDYAGDSGLLLGVWNSNANPFGGNEFDVYAGYLHKLSDTVLVDVGVLGYIFSEDEERPNTDTNGDSVPDKKTNLDTVEFFTSLFAGPVKLQAYYSDDYTGTDEAGYYYTGTYTHSIKEGFTVAAQLGYTHGDGAELVYGDSYFDYSLALNKTIREGLVFTLLVVDTNLKDEGLFVAAEDKPKFMVSAKQTFSF